MQRLIEYGLFEYELAVWVLVCGMGFVTLLAVTT